MDDDRDIPEEEAPVEESTDKQVEDDLMTDAEGGFAEGAEGDVDYFEDDDDQKAVIDEDEVIED